MDGEGTSEVKKHGFIKDLVLLAAGAVLAGGIDVFWVNPAQVAETKAIEQEAIVKELSNRFDFIDADYEYKDAIEKVYESYKDEKEKAEHSEKTIKDLNSQIASLTADVSISTAVDRAKEYAQNEDYVLAVVTLNGVSSQTAEITTLVDEYEKLAAAQLWSNVRAMIANGEYDQAEQAIDDYNLELPEGYDIDELRAEIKSVEPIPISDLVVVDSKDWSVNEGKPIDNFGNEHYSDYTSLITNLNTIWPSEGDHYVEYRNNKEHSKLTGKISPYDEIESATVRIILDDNTVQTYELGKKTDPISFEFDISKIDYIRFEVDLLWDSGVIISDVTVSK